VEPEWYAPVLPMLLVNGARGIGTGYSTYIPPCNPKTLKSMLIRWLKGEQSALDEELPIYFEGFKGTIAGDTATGVWKKVKDEVIVTELPPGTWTADYRTWLEKELAEGRIKDFTDISTDKDVHIIIKGIDETVLQKSLTFQAKKTNMHAFNARGVITKYDRVNDILKEYAEVRLGLYETRRQQQIRDLQNELPFHTNVMRFIEDQISDNPKVDLRRKPRGECDGILQTHKYDKIEDNYEYILKLPVSTFTAESILKHRMKLESLRKEIQELQGITASQLWLGDLQQV
jgi:DNA topoisomerase-2